MSDHYLQFVPADPRAQPSQGVADEAVRLLASFVPTAMKVSARFTQSPVFYDCGENWCGVWCSACGKDTESWWVEAMNRAWDATRFEDIAIVTPCCGAQMSLNDLRYDMPMAFGRFVLEAENPNINTTTPEQDQKLAECLGFPLRKINVHR